jgi:hypothetical protein
VILKKVVNILIMLLILMKVKNNGCVVKKMDFIVKGVKKMESTIHFIGLTIEGNFNL